MDSSRCILTVGNEERVPAHLHSLFSKLLGHALPIGVGGHKYKYVPRLKLFSEPNRFFVGGQGSHTGGKARH
ncbi:hypothetical protein KAT59_06260, partial [Candidatus Bipolaricaulota bacterium]|nr:hypothetical protein [Candidatus Bipolaricaulota bacterium]